MAITYGTITTQAIMGVASVSFSHTVAAGTDKLIFRLGWWDGNAADISLVKYNGVALTKIADSGESSGGDRAEIWKLEAPPVGTFTMTATFPASASGTCSCINVVGTSTTDGTAATAIGSSTAPSVNATSASGESVVDAMGHDDTGSPTTTVGAGQTQDFNAANNGENGAGSHEAGAATVTMSWTLSASETWAIAAISLKPSAAAAPSALPQLLRGRQGVHRAAHW